MRMRKHTGLFVLAACALCLLLPNVTLAEENYIDWESDPKESAAVMAGDTIRYTATLKESAQAGDWTALRIRLGDGLLLQPDSIAVTLAQQPTASFAPEETPKGTTAPDETAAPDEAADDAATGRENVEWEIVPGNDGFVLLLSNIHAGDTVSFSATVQEAGEASAAVRADAFTSAVAHTRIVKPTPAPAASTAPAPIVAQESTPGAIQILLAIAIAIVLGLMGVMAYRRFVRKQVRAVQQTEAVEEPEESTALPQTEEKQDIEG